MRPETSEKERLVKKLIGGFGPVDEIVTMEDISHYRNKVSAAFGYEKGQIISGVYEPGTHRIINTDSSEIEDEKADEIIVYIRKLCKSFKIKTYDEDTGYGLLRHVQVRVGKATGQIMVTIVTTTPIFPGSKNFCKALLETFPEITTIVQDINSRTDSMILSGKEKILYGKGYIEDILCRKRFRISPTAFYQVNHDMTEKLYAKAIEFAGLTGGETILDAYCGIGTIGIIAADRAKQVIGVELNKAAVRDAVSNARINEIKNIDFYSNDAGRFIVQMAEQGGKVDVVIMDPPRAGSTKEFIDSIEYMKVPRVVYVSCNPETLARDLKRFASYGYKMEKAVPFDCFPMTEHVECVVLMSRVDK